MAKPRRKPRATQQQPATDLGPSILRDRGLVAVETPADPDAPNRTIRRARRVWAPDVLRANGTLEAHHHAAAVRYLTSYEVGICGARSAKLVYIQHCATPAGMADAQLAAATDYRRATQAVGQVASAALAWCVLHHGSVASWADLKDWPPHRAQGYLVCALDVLAAHYGLA